MNTERRLYQWDTGQKLVGCTGLYVDFPIGTEVYRVETTDGMCIIPDELLQTSGGHKVYECMTNNTIRSFAFSVTPRPKPPDYVYTPTERLTFEGLVQKVDDAVADMIRGAESGEFDGYTPVKGKDYFTTAEIQQIQNEVSSGAIGDFKTVVDTETDEFNANATEKVNAYNQNDSGKTASYNANATEKLNAYNTNANNRVAEFDAHTEQIQTDISELKSDIADYKDGFKRNNLFAEAELYAENKLLFLTSGGAIHAADDDRFNIYILRVDGESKYTCNASLRYCACLSIDKKATSELMANKTQIDTSSYSNTAFIAFSFNKNTTSISDFVISKGNEAVSGCEPPKWYTENIYQIDRKISDNVSKIESRFNDVYDTSIDFEDGTISATGVFESGANVAIRSKKIVFLPKGTRIYTSKDYYVRLAIFTDANVTPENSQSKFISRMDYTNDFVTKNDCYCIVNVTRRDSATIDINDAVSNLVIGLFGDFHRDNIRKVVYDAVAKYADDIIKAESDLTIPIMTDVHWDKDKEPFVIFNYLANRGVGDYCFCLGDLLPKHYDNKTEATNTLKWMYESLNHPPIVSDLYTLIGNHDTNVVKTGQTSDRSSMITNSELYSLSGARTKDGYYQARKNYGFIDIDRIKVRLIWLDCADVYDHATGERLSTNSEVMLQQEQYDWFGNVALKFTSKNNPQEWSVITLTHASFSNLALGGFRMIVKAFIMGGRVDNYISTCTIGGANNQLVANVDYSEQGAMTYICNICGHAHYDAIVDLGGDTNVKEVYVPCMRTGAVYYDDNPNRVFTVEELVEIIRNPENRKTYVRNPEDETFDILDTMILDKEHRTVTFKRFGAGSDRQISY